ncbi:AfsR/SARP family transcriptional regulator [Streptacidiphilus sp. 4-A2]|nr:AfsR/SARP family transcriptional regulator [Streptacidiphilus sp. 4-A2]
MDINVLGSLSVCDNGLSIVPTAPKPRQVLALLALRADQVVPVAELVEELWDGSPPRSARTTLQTYMLNLRERIREALVARGDGHTSPKDVLATLPSGYCLHLGGGSVDFHDFERLAGTGYRAMDAGDHAGASRRLREALALWSGPALADVSVGSRLRTEVDRMEESRLCALDQRIDADLRLGRHRELLPELTVLVSRYRMHESLHGQFMVALYLSGRRSEALKVYQRLRDMLVAEAGLEPSPAIGRLQRQILQSSPRCCRPVSRPRPTG